MKEIDLNSDEADAQVHERIAQRVKDLRAARGLTLEGLAAQSGVSRSMISLIERGTASPTAVVLNKLAAGLGVSLASLFAGPSEDGPAPKPLVSAAEQTIWKDPESGYLRRSLSPPGWPSPLQLTEVQLPPGARIAYEVNARDASLHQQIWMSQGQLDITLGSERHSLHAGDCFAMRLGQPIIFSNPAGLSARYLIAICDVASFNLALKASA